MVASIGTMEGNPKEERTARRRKLFRKLLNLGMFGVVVEVICLYVVLAPVFWVPLFNTILFQPDHNDYDMKTVNAQFASMFHVNREDLMFDGPRGTKLSGSYFALPGNDKVILLSHGNGGNIAHRIPAVVNLLASGFSVLLYDYEGYGKSTGKPSVKNVCEDAVAAFDYLVKVKHVNATNIILFGESLGSGVTCSLLTKRSCGGVIIQSGFDSLFSVARDKLVWLNFYPEISLASMRMNNTDVLSKQHPPLLIIHGAQDDLINIRHAENLMKEAAEPKKMVVLPNAGHNDIYTANSDISVKALKEFRQSLGN